MRVVGIDTGGTFTDFILFDGRGIRTHKVLSTPDDPSRAVLQGLRDLGAIDADVVHGSTVATNAFLERKGARLTLVTTKGFEDLLEIGRQERGSLYDLDWERPEPLVPRSRRIGIRERTDAQGRVVVPLDRAALRRVRAKDVAVCFLHSYANPGHERQAGRILRGATLSCDVLPEYREYERLSTTVLNAYVAPVVDEYLRSLGRSLRRIRILASDGGAITPESAGRRAAQTLLSGPAGGVIAAQSLGFGKVIAFDMGGTSTDVCLIDGTATVTKEGSIGGLPLRVPHFGIHTVGAGGGSIARVDEGGALRVGPESAGATPGPLCYGRGGTQPTVTDANVRLSRIDRKGFLGGRMALTTPDFPKAFARGILEVVNATMERALRKVSIERGHDPADFWLLAYGGAGPLHACDLAGRLGMKGVVVPRWPGLFSALGMVLADMTVEKSRTVIGRTLPWTELEREARRELKGRVERFVEARYRGQSHEIRIPDGADFHEAHRRLYGFVRRDPVEIVNAVVRVTAAQTKPRPERAPRSRRPKRIGSPGRGHLVVGREGLRSGDEVVGPAAIGEETASTWVPKGWTARVDSYGNMIICQ
ncbi:MAG TPA: hydantoinase/oxoprolinase family protein [Planctomycetota bacterium]|nr:hydantoinase/oxoprolinase family protein [Planctomycetota bacterium]